MRLYADNGDNLAPIDRVLPKLQRVKQGPSGWSAQCPAHEDKHPSLTVAIGDDGRVLLNCHKGCSYGEVMTALGLAEADGFPADSPIAFVAPSNRRIVATYDYHDEQHHTLFQTVRYAPKDFRQRHSNGNGEWVWNLGGVRRVLYRLPEIQQADLNVMVWLVEGEKDADYLASLGFIATTSPMGASNWKPEYAEFLRGRHVVIVPDNDGAGAQYAAAAMQSLHDVAASTRVILLPGIGPKQDVSDWLDAGHSAEELAALAQAAPETLEVPLIEEEAEAPRYTIHRAAEAFLPIPPIEWVIGDLFSRGSVNVLCGPPGSKKTYTAIDMAVCVALGVPWLGRPVTQGPVLLIDEESGNNRLRRRLFEAMKAYGADEHTPIYWTALEMFNLRQQSEIDHVDRLIGEVGPILTVIDALADVMPGADENTVQDTHPIMQNIRALAERHRCAIEVLHHANKVGGYRGSSAIAGAVDLMLMVESAKDSIDIKYSTEKCRDSGHQTFNASIQFDLQHGSVRLVSSMAAAPSARSMSEQYVLSFIKDSGGSASIIDIKANASCCSPATAERTVYRLAAEGLIKRSDGGKVGEKAVYSIVASNTPVGYWNNDTSATSADLCNADLAERQTSATSASLLEMQSAEVPQRLPAEGLN